MAPIFLSRKQANDTNKHTIHAATSFLVEHLLAPMLRALGSGWRRAQVYGLSEPHFRDLQSSQAVRQAITHCCNHFTKFYKTTTKCTTANHANGDEDMNAKTVHSLIEMLFRYSLNMYCTAIAHCWKTKCISTLKKCSLDEAKVTVIETM